MNKVMGISERRAAGTTAEIGYDMVNSGGSTLGTSAGN